MAAIRPPSPDAEDLLFSLNMLKSLKLTTSTRSGTPKTFAAAQERLLNELRLGRVVGVFENYLLIRATRARRPQLLQLIPPPNPVDPMTDQLRQARKDFFQLVRLWQVEFKVNLSKLRRWSDFMRLRDLRHVVVHRLGLWQPGLDPKPTLSNRIRQVASDPDRYRGPIPLSAQDFEDARVLALDLLAQIERRRVK
jgi:hypothetical protein